jgi:RNA polymerase sigma-70 factor (ECF subfamily)
MTSAHDLYSRSGVDDDADFEAFWRRMHLRLVRYVERCYHHVDADEIVQETMLRCYENWARLDPSRDAWPWLVVVARNVATDHIRARARRDDMERAADTTLADPVQPEDAICARELADAVRDAVASLREPDRRVMTLHHFDEVPTAAIAALTGRSENAVRQQLFRARRRFAANFTSLRSGTAGALVPALLRLRRWSRQLLPASVPAAAVSVVACAGLLTVAGIGADVARGHHAAHAAAPSIRPHLVLDDDAHDLARHSAPASPAGGDASPVGTGRGTVTPTGPDDPASPVPFVTTRGNPLQGDKPSDERVWIPVGEHTVYVNQYDSNTPGYGLVCATGAVVHCGDQ